MCVFLEKYCILLKIYFQVTRLILMPFLIAIGCAVVKAYQYTSITSVMLLDCWSIPTVMLLTWVFLKTKYRFRKITGVVVCIAGLVIVVFSDVHAGDRAGSHFPCLIHLVDSVISKHSVSNN